MTVYNETINLGGNISEEAKSASSQMTVLSKAITSTQAAMTKVSATHGVMSKEYMALSKKASALEEAQGKIPKGLLAEAAAHKSLSSSHAKSSAAAAAAAKESQKLAKAHASATTAATATTNSAGGLQAELAEVTGGLSIVAEVAGGVVLAFGAVVVAGASMAIEAVEAKEKMVSLFDALGDGKIAGREAVAMLDSLGDSIGQTRKQLAPFAQQFLTMGVTGTDQLRQLTLAAASASAMADGGGDAFTTMFKKIQNAAATGQALKIPLKGLGALEKMGLKVDDVAQSMGISAKDLGAQLKDGSVNAGKFGDALQDALIKKGAGPLAKAGMSLSSVWGKAQENVQKLFEDVDLGGFLGEVRTLFDIFGQGKDSGKALKSGIGAFFKEVFAMATKVVPLVKHFLLDCIIFGLKAYLAIKPIVKSLMDAWKQHDGMSKLLAVWNLMKPALVVIGVVIGVVVAAVVLLGLTLLGIQAVILGVGAAIVGFSAKAMQVLVDWALGAAKAAADFVSGLVNGISSGAGAVVDAVKGLASGAKNAFKSALGIASPSKVMMQLGGHVAGGVAEGMSDGASDVHAASGDLAGAATGGFSGGASGGGGGGGKMITINGGLHVHAPNAKDMQDISEAAFALLMERVALTQAAQ